MDTRHESATGRDASPRRPRERLRVRCSGRLGEASLPSKLAASAIGFVLLATTAFAQPIPERWANETDLGGSLVRTEGSGVVDEDVVKTAREVASHSTGTPEWTNPKGFEKDVF